MKNYLLILILPALLVAQTPTGSENAQSMLFKESRIIPDITDIYGAAWVDLDNDTHTDLYLVSFRGLNRLLLNYNNRETFLDGTIQTGLGGNLMPRGIINLELGNAIFDWDNDGDQDVLICGWGEATRFYQNEGDLQFTDITDKLNIKGPYDFNDAVVADVNNDGYPDLFFTDEHYANRLLLNQDGICFMDFSAESGLDFNSISQTASFSDVDLDGDPDLYVTNWYEADWFFENTGEAKFIRKDLNIITCIEKISSNSSSFADIDNDGDFDLFVATRDGRNRLFINKRKETGKTWIFYEKTDFISSNDPFNTYGGNFADVNLDGWLDLFLTNNGPNILYLNNMNNKFVPAYIDTLFPGPASYSTGSAFADFDKDGDADLFVANKDTFSILYENQTNTKNFICIELEGVLSNANAFGTKVFLFEADSQKIIASREMNGGTAYLSQNDKKLIFGVEPDLSYRAEVHFPSGEIIELNNMSAAGTYSISEFSSPQKEIRWFFYHSWRSIRSFDFWLMVLQWILLIGIVIAVFYFTLKKYLIRQTEEKLREEYLLRLEEKNDVLKEKNEEIKKLFEEFKSTQSQLVLSEKMASLGRLVAGVAHELNNPISFIYANVHQLSKYTRKIDDALKSKTDFKDVDELFKEIDELIEETQKGSQAVKELVQNLRRFSHLDSAEWQIEDIHNGLETSLMILKPEIKKSVSIRKGYGDIPSVECHPGQINQVFLNILTNAVQAIDEKGIVSIVTRKSGDGIEIEISDNGKGISKENIANIFDPFYSTKAVGEGTGLGLSISLTIIKNHNGNIEVESESGQGTKFIISLPIHQKSKGE